MKRAIVFNEHGSKIQQPMEKEDPKYKTVNNRQYVKCVGCDEYIDVGFFSGSKIVGIILCDNCKEKLKTLLRGVK